MECFDNQVNLRTLVVGSDLTGLPEGVFDNLTNLKSLSVNGDLTALPEGILSNLTGLEGFYAGGNQLTTLPDGLFDSLTKLTRVSLSDNPGAPFVFGLEIARNEDGSIVINVSDENSVRHKCNPRGPGRLTIRHGSHDTGRGQ